MAPIVNGGDCVKKTYKIIVACALAVAISSAAVALHTLFKVFTSERLEEIQPLEWVA